MTTDPQSAVPGVTEDRNYRVVVFAAPDEPSDLGQVLERILGMHPTDAHVRARSMPGVLPDSLSAEIALRLSDEIRATGIQSAVVTIHDIPGLDDAEVVHHARCGAHGLEIVGLYGESEHLIPWQSIELISFGQIPQETTRHFATSDMNSIHSGRRTGPSTLETALSPGPEVWIACADPERFFRVDHKRMNYEYLAERKTDSATANFRFFLEDLVARAGHAYRTPATRVYLHHGSVADYSFESADALQRATMLHLLLHRRAKSASGT